MEERKIITSFGEEPKSEKFQIMTKADRWDFINYMMEQKDKLQAKNATAMAKELAETYRNEKHLRVGVEWVKALIRFRIAKYDNGDIEFLEEVPFTVDDMCASPSIFRTITNHRR